MSLIPLILDHPADYVRGPAGPVSLLTLPLETGTVLDRLLRRLERIAHGEILVLSSFQGEEIERSLDGRGPLPIRTVTDETLHQVLDRYEASDYLLVVDPRLWPTGGHDFSDCQSLIETYHGATHVVAVGASGESARERVERDACGNVRRVQRLYASKNYSEVGGWTITHSVVPLRAAIGFRFNLPVELRMAMAATGIMSQDQPRRIDVAHLATPGGFLTLTEHTVSHLCREPEVAGYAARSGDVLLGSGCKVHRSARLVGPLVIQPEVTIEEGALVIGPAILGRGARVAREAAVIHSAVGVDSIIAPGVTVRQQVVSGHCTAEAVARNGAPAAAPAEIVPATSVRGPTDKFAWRMLGPARGRWLHFGLKRAMDIVLSAVALLALAPLLALVAFLIKLDSRGPLLFAHRREGRKGRDFPCWKFRTMVEDAHQRQRQLYTQSEVDGPQFKIRDDPRVTGIGRWLRSTNIDELPQLINVLLGHMSLVGPRPSPFRENQICIPWRRARLSVRPGITGLWQVCRDENRMKGDFHEWIFYDMTYVRHFSIWLDVKILVATVVTMGGRWSVPLSWLLPRLPHGADSQEYSVSAA